MALSPPPLGCAQQYFGSSACNARHRRIAANDGGRERALAEELELGGKLVRLLDAQPIEQTAIPQPTLLFELHGDGRRFFAPQPPVRAVRAVA